jgi:hypothetical protein
LIANRYQIWFQQSNQVCFLSTASSFLVKRRRYVIAYNPQQAELDPINREQILERLSCELEVLNQKKKTKAQCKVMLHRSMGRYVKELKSGKLKIDKAKSPRMKNWTASICCPPAISTCRLKTSPWATSSFWKLNVPLER